MKVNHAYCRRSVNLAKDNTQCFLYTIFLRECDHFLTYSLKGGKNRKFVPSREVIITRKT